MPAFRIRSYSMNDTIMQLFDSECPANISAGSQRTQLSTVTLDFVLLAQAQLSTRL